MLAASLVDHLLHWPRGSPSVARDLTQSMGRVVRPRSRLPLLLCKRDPASSRISTKTHTPGAERTPAGPGALGPTRGRRHVLLVPTSALAQGLSLPPSARVHDQLWSQGRLLLTPPPCLHPVERGEERGRSVEGPSLSPNTWVHPSSAGHGGDRKQRTAAGRQGLRAASVSGGRSSLSAEPEGLSSPQERQRPSPHLGLRRDRTEATILCTSLPRPRPQPVFLRRPHCAPLSLWGLVP